MMHYILITNMMQLLLFIHKILFSCTCFEPQVLIFRRIQLYTCSIWYCHSSWWSVGTQLEWELCTILLYMFRASSAHLQEDTVVHMQHMVPSQFLVACRYTAWVLTQAVYRQVTTNSRREWQYHVQHMVLSQFLVACRYTAWVLTQAVYRRQWQYHMLHVYNCILLKMSTWGSKHVEENSTQFSLKLCTDRPPQTPVDSDSTMCCMYTTVSSWRWALEARNM